MILTNAQGRTLYAKAFYLGQTTNNVAEYCAVIKALEAARQLGATQVELCSDSELLVKQLNGQYRVKSPNIKPLYEQASTLLAQFKRWTVRHVMRAKNKHADHLVNRALDAKKDIEENPQDSTASTKPMRLGVLLSGGGRTLLNLMDYIRNGRLHAEVPIVISSRSTVAGVERSRNAGLDVHIIRKKDFSDIDAFSQALKAALSEAQVDLVIQAGWLCLWKIPARYEHRVMNIHPALLPSFGGQGMWGHHVHEAVLKAGCKVSGCTVHFCTDEYDTGPIIIQRTCPVKEDDTPDTLAARVFEQECIAYPEAIRLFAEDRLSIQGQIVKIRS
jgi:formyltetrahydrofolate-dependent phosphoribosylglycinamide formyltransferase